MKTIGHDRVSLRNTSESPRPMRLLGAGSCAPRGQSRIMTAISLVTPAWRVSLSPTTAVFFMGSAVMGHLRGKDLEG
jgi:hypothetical protein